MVIWVFLDVRFYSRCIPVDIYKSVSITYKSCDHFASLAVVITELISKCATTQYLILYSRIRITAKIVRIEICIDIWPGDSTIPCGDSLITISKGCTIFSSTECERFYINAFIGGSCVACKIITQLYVEICMICGGWWIYSSTNQYWSIIGMMGLYYFCDCISWEGHMRTWRCICESWSIGIETCGECKRTLRLCIHVSLQNRLNSLFFTHFVNICTSLEDKVPEHHSKKCHDQYEYKNGSSAIV